MFSNSEAINFSTSGKCFYNDVAISPNETTNMSEPCQAWTCIIERQLVEITG